MDALELKIKQLEQQLRLKEDSFSEERKEFQAYQTQMESDNHTMYSEKLEMASSLASLEQKVNQQGELEERLKRLEMALISGNNGPTQTPTVEDLVISDDKSDGQMGKEKSIELTFGDDTSPHMLEKFIAHYSLVDRINKARGVRVWKKPDYRALMLRSALRGAASEFVENAENIMLTPWVKNDQEILQKLKERYVTNAAIELHIIQFETASQLEGEPLSEYMVRLQRLMEKAYSTHPQFIKGVRVVWQFLNGLRDRDVREALIKEKWMEDGEKAKDYDEILKIAESVVNAKVAARATGQVKAVEVRKGTIGALASAGSAAGKKSPKNKGRYRKSYSPYAGEGSSKKDFLTCWYCEKKDHEGGWQQCPLREEKDPQWRPGKNSSGFGRAPRY